MTSKKELLAHANFGQRIAEDEVDELSNYFVETDQWRQILGGRADVVYGAKGSGKSALYSLLRANFDVLGERGIVLATGEKPRGSPVFKNLVGDPPASEVEFVALWKFYIAGIVAEALHEKRVDNANARELFAHLRRAGLWEAGSSLASLLSDALDYVKRLLRPEAVEGTVHIDPSSGMPSGFTGKVVLSEPTAQQRGEGLISVDRLMGIANEALEGQFKIWILLDRLDVAFSEHVELEKNALRALFRAYLDCFDLENIRLKIFLRTDIWSRITEEGFREASHVTRHVTITWGDDALLNLIVRRILHNDAIAEFLGVDRAAVLASVERQKEIFYRIFPPQVDVGPNKPSSFDWMLSRTRDAAGHNVPRELIHLLNELRVVQIRKLELGELAPEVDILFSRSTFKEALPEVSSVRLQQTLLAEYPRLRESIEMLRQAKTEQTPESLASIWHIEPAEARRRADLLKEVGFFELRGTAEAPRYWVPFLYRDALDLVQGLADAE